MKIHDSWSLIKDAARSWSADGASRLAASLAFYTTFSLAPILMITVAVVGFVLGKNAATGALMRQIEGIMGHSQALVIQQIVQDASRPAAGTWATIVALITLLFGASGVFAELQAALNIVWKVPEKTRPWSALIKERMATFGIVLAIGFVLLVSLLLTTVIAALGKHFSSPGLWQVVNTVLSFIVVTALFALIYKLLPECRIAWRDVWVGAAATSLLFTVGKQLLGFYLGHFAAASAYGPAGSFVVLLVWVYYSAQIFLFGAELTVAWSNRHGSRACLPEAHPRQNRYPLEPAPG